MKAGFTLPGCGLAAVRVQHSVPMVFVLVTHGFQWTFYYVLHFLAHFLKEH